MSKILFFVVLAVAAYLFLRFHKFRQPRREDSVRNVEAMVACTRCGVHVPRSEALEVAGRYFCSEEHRALGPG
jgi:uncharacterized protein